MHSRQQAASKLTTEGTRSIINGLRELGLTTYEAQAYVALIQNPDISATRLCNDSGIPDSKIYFALEELQKKGLVVVSEGIPRLYKALHPKEALEKVKLTLDHEHEGKLEKLSQLTMALEPLYRRGEREDVELAYVVKGFNNVLRSMNEALRNAKREAVVFVPEPKIYDLMAQQLVSLRRKGVKVRLAVPTKNRKTIENSQFTEVREMTPDCEDCWLVVVDGKTVISSSMWRTEQCHAILTQDPVLVSMSREYYESPRCCMRQ